MNRYSVSNGKHTIVANKDFGFNSNGNLLSYFDGNNATASMLIKTEGNSKLTIDIESWGTNQIAFNQTSGGKQGQKLMYTFNQLTPNSYYTVRSNGKQLMHRKSNANGSFVLNQKTSGNTNKIVISKG
jgi:hypothetical protein